MMCIKSNTMQEKRRRKKKKKKEKKKTVKVGWVVEVIWRGGRRRKK